MESKTMDKPTETEQRPECCQCAAQITAILLRLEKLEREALTESKLSDLPRSSLAETVAKMALR